MSESGNYKRVALRRTAAGVNVSSKVVVNGLVITGEVLLTPKCSAHTESTYFREVRHSIKADFGVCAWSVYESYQIDSHYYSLGDHLVILSTRMHQIQA